MSDERFLEDTLKAHNEYRLHHQVSSLSLNKELSAHAQRWADHLADSNNFKHSDCSLGGDRLGENIAMKWSSKPDTYTGQNVTDQWYSEIKDHTFGEEPRSQKSGHFTQVVWKGSKELGVGKAQTQDGKIIVVANYRPAGNMIGDFSRNVLPPKDGKIVIKEKEPDDSSFPSHDSSSSGGFTKGESRSVRTFTTTEGVGANKVTKKITEETIIKPDGEKIVNRKEEVTTGGN